MTFFVVLINFFIDNEKDIRIFSCYKKNYLDYFKKILDFIEMNKNVITCDERLNILINTIKLYPGFPQLSIATRNNK